MFLSIKIKEFDPHHIIISEKIKNNIMIGSDFYRIIWSSEITATKGLFIYFNLKNIFIEKYFNKIKCIFASCIENNNEISSIKSIEKMILNKFNNLQNKKFAYRIQEQLENGFIKLYAKENIKYGKYKDITFLLKISGIWVSNQTNEFGLTFRFFIVNNLFLNNR